LTWIQVAAVSDLDGLEVLGIRKDGRDIAIYRLGPDFFATHNICTHQFAHLSEGYVVDGCIECPLHQGLFDIRSGKAQGGIVKTDLKTYPVRVEDGQIMVLLD
jgi:nitrite reductase/ring-hydroxylating ferredoxin subunit